MATSFQKVHNVCVLPIERKRVSSVADTIVVHAREREREREKTKKMIEGKERGACVKEVERWIEREMQTSERVEWRVSEKVRNGKRL
jgi:hypothetical protein